MYVHTYVCVCVHVHEYSLLQGIRLFVYTQTIHQQNIKKIVEDKDSQITKVASDLKSREEEVEQLKHDANIKMVNFMCFFSIH